MTSFHLRLPGVPPSSQSTCFVAEDFCLSSDLLEVHAFPRAVRSRDEGHAAAVGDVGVVRDETLDRELLVERFCRVFSQVSDGNDNTREPPGNRRLTLLTHGDPNFVLLFARRIVLGLLGDGGSLFEVTHHAHRDACIHPCLTKFRGVSVRFSIKGLSYEVGGWSWLFSLLLRLHSKLEVRRPNVTGSTGSAMG